MAWTAADLQLVGIDDDASAGDIVTIIIATPVGRVEMMAEIEIDGRTAIARQVHMQSEAGPNAFGPAALRMIAEFVLQEIDCDEARVEGATRTTGAGPGRKPGRIRFARRRRDPPG